MGGAFVFQRPVQSEGLVDVMDRKEELVYFGRWEELWEEQDLEEETDFDALIEAELDFSATPA